jgi:hypothetical protein
MGAGFMTDDTSDREIEKSLRERSVFKKNPNFRHSDSSDREPPPDPCPNGVEQAVHALIRAMAGNLARSWKDDPATIAWFTAAGGVTALAAHGYRMTVHPGGHVLLERA